MQETDRGDARAIQEYLRHVRDLLAAVDVGQVGEAVRLLRAARDRGSTIYVIGNGGSAATAAHFATDLGKSSPRSGGHRPLRVMSIGDNLPWLTALANDEGYENVFTGTLAPFLGEGDVLIAISVSGSSANLIRAVELARARRAVCISFLGADGGELLRRSDHVVHVPADRQTYGPVEDVHHAVHHIIAMCMART